MKKHINILCTSVGNPAFPAIADALRNSGDFTVNIIGTDIRKEAPGLYLADKAYIVSKHIDEKFIDDIWKIIRDEKIDILLPLSTVDQNYFSIRKIDFEGKGIKVMVSDADAVLIANNKFRLYEFLKERNINPLHCTRAKVEELENLKNEYKTPFVLKSEEGTGGQGTLIVSESEDSLKEDDRKFFLPMEKLNKSPEQYISGKTIISEYLPGDEFSVDTLSYKGRFIYAVIRKRFKSIGGLALESTVVHDAAILELSKKIVSEIGLSYVNNLQFKMSDAHVYKMMEINPRIPGTIKLSLSAGANMVTDAVKLALGDMNIPIPGLAIGTSIFRYWDGAIASPEAINSLIILHPSND
jgi:carbamoyl-phosphate synthase large subunit